MSCALHGVFLCEQYGNRSARNKMHPSVIHKADLTHFSRSVYMQNRLLSAYTTGFQTSILCPKPEPRWRLDNGQHATSSLQPTASKAPLTAKYLSSTALQLPIPSTSNTAYQALVPHFTSQSDPTTIALLSTNIRIRWIYPSTHIMP